MHIRTMYILFLFWFLGCVTQPTTNICLLQKNHLLRWKCHYNVSPRTVRTEHSEMLSLLLENARYYITFNVDKLMLIAMAITQICKICILYWAYLDMTKMAVSFLIFYKNYITFHLLDRHCIITTHFYFQVWNMEDQKEQCYQPTMIFSLQYHFK